MSNAAPSSHPAGVGLSASERTLAALYVPAAVALYLLAPGGHPLLVLPMCAAMATYLLQRVINLPLADGYVSIVQPAFVVLLFALPLNLVAIFVPLGLFASTIVSNRSVSPRRFGLALADAWYCVPPVIILALFAPGRFLWHHWPVYVAALVAEIAVSFVDPLLRFLIHRETRQLDPSILVLPAAIDLLLTPLGAAAAHAGANALEESILVLASVLTLVALLGHERTVRLGYEQRALRDGLTGLANRALFDELLDATSRRLERSDGMGALLFIDLDNFKQVNDVHGHPAGDTVLRTTATRVQNAVRDADTVARFGGDEFAVLLTDPTSRDAVERVASLIRATVAEPIQVAPNIKVTVTASIGMAFLGRETETADAVARADQAMYDAKQVTHQRFAYRS
jgi:diguanylate cyclase (GGDEF)-like protein